MLLQNKVAASQHWPIKKLLIHYNPPGKLNPIIPIFLLKPKKKKNITKKKKKSHDRISAILDFLSCFKALAAISLALTEEARNFLSLSAAFIAFSWAISAIWVASAIVWITILSILFASCNSLRRIDSFCCTKGVASFLRIQVGLSIQWKKGHLGPTCS